MKTPNSKGWYCSVWPDAMPLRERLRHWSWMPKRTWKGRKVSEREAARRKLLESL